MTAAKLQTKPPIAMTALGDLEGAWEGGIAAFRGVPFAEPPVGRLRFAPPEPPTRWAGVRKATANGPVAPQMTARLARAMGDYALAQDEDCLTLSVWTPEPGAGRRPVMFWIHGGAFITGAGSVPWYDGGQFARRHGIVVVGINYRLGAFGFLRHPGLSPGNLGIRDQIAALRWVKEHIAAFGGDPDQVTIFGESAGGFSVHVLLGSPLTKGLFRRAIIQSAPVGLYPTAEQAEAHGKRFLDTAKLDAAGLRALPTAAVMEAQAAFNRASAQFGVPSLPLRPHIDGIVIPADPHAAAIARTREVEVMIGWTRDEMAAFLAGAPEIEDMTEEKRDELFRARFGERAPAALARARRRNPGAKPGRLLEAAVTEGHFAAPSVDYAEAAAQSGRPIWLYRFDWHAPANGFRACHTLELPFVFDSYAAWDAPMLKGADPDDVRRVSGLVQATWAAFAKTGDPNHADLPHWPRYRAPDRLGLRIDSCVETVGDLGGVAWR